MDSKNNGSPRGDKEEGRCGEGENRYKLWGLQADKPLM